MKKIELLAIAAVFSLIISFAMAMIVGMKSSDYLYSEISQKIINSAEASTYKIESQMNHMTGLVDSLVADAISDNALVSEETFSSDNSIGSVLDSKAEFMRNSLQLTSQAHSLYLVINPELTDQPVERWFKRADDGTITELFVDPKKKSSDFADSDSAEMQYFYRAKDNRSSGVWTGMYHDDDIDEDVFSYSRAIYCGNLFIGVAGADMSAGDAKSVIYALKPCEGGTASMMDENLHYIIKPSVRHSDSRRLQDAARKHIKNRSGIFTYRNGDNVRMVAGYAVMNNGWTITVVQPYKTAYSPISDTKSVIVLVAAFLGVLIMLFMYANINSFTMREKLLEQENKKKEMLLSYESRRAKVGEMVGNVAHQWKQPLHTINLIVANLKDSCRYEELDEALVEKSADKIKNITAGMTETITDFSMFLKPDKPAAVKFSLTECIDGALLLMEESIALNRVEIIKEYGHELTVTGYPNELRHALFNVLDNARDAVVSGRTSGRRIVVSADRTESCTEIRILDNGSGISAEGTARAFDPYYTTKKTRGTGLGLYITKNIIENRMGGKIALLNEHDGTCCVISLPHK